MKAVIVAAGISSRLYPLTLDMPKPLLTIGEVSLITRSVHLMKSYGIADIVVVVGFKGDQIREHLGDAVTYIENPAYATTNNMASFNCARDAVWGHPFLYLHADLIWHPRILERCMASSEDICFVVDRKPCDQEDMKVRVEDGHILEADKGIPLGEAFGEWIGMIRFSPGGGQNYFDEIGQLIQERADLYDCYAVQGLAARGVGIHYVLTEGLPWVEIDFPRDFQMAKELFGPGNSL